MRIMFIVTTQDLGNIHTFRCNMVSILTDYCPFYMVECILRETYYG